MAILFILSKYTDGTFDTKVSPMFFIWPMNWIFQFFYLVRSLKSDPIT